MQRRSFLGFIATLTGVAVVRKYAAIKTPAHLGTAGAPVKNGGISWIPLSELWIHTDHIIEGPAHDENLRCLANSIGKYGIFSPLLVNKNGQIVSGIQRYRAMTERLALSPGTLVPCIIRDFYDHQVKEVRDLQSFTNDAMWREAHVS
jgi:ParB-like nuclease family protein